MSAIVAKDIEFMSKSVNKVSIALHPRTTDPTSVRANLNHPRNRICQDLARVIRQSDYIDLCRPSMFWL
jgi:hypothetical protein